MAGSVILGGARTPFGKFSGSLAGFSGAQLGGKAIAGALERTGISADQVDYVLMGQVLQAGAGQITARQAAVEAGIPLDVPATTINKVCLSGINTIMLADLLIQAGEAEIIVAGGMESMTNAPYLLRDARSGMRIGRQDRRRLDDARLAVLCHRRAGDGRVHRAVRRQGGPQPRRPGRAVGTKPRARRRSPEGRQVRQRDHLGGDPPAQGRSDRVGGRRGRSRRVRPPSRSASCVPRSPRTATSPPATPRRSPTAAPPSSSARLPRPKNWA
jgi:hypothetical protein